MEKEDKLRKRSLKRRIRDTKRLLARDDLPETVRLTKERILGLLEREAAKKQHGAHSKKIAKKYRMVRFFEKRKVTRRLKSRLREIKTCTSEDERSDLLGEIHHLKRELNYVTHYPTDQKYVALFPSSDTTSEKALLKKEKLMSQITEQVENGTLPNMAENPHLHKGAEPSRKATNDTKSLLSTPSDLARHKRVLCCNPVNEDGNEAKTNRKPRAKGQQCAVTGRTIKRHIAAVDEEPESESELYQQSQKRLKDDDFFL